MKTKKKYCVIRNDILEKGQSIPTGVKGTKYIYTMQRLEYRWKGDVFLVKYQDKWTTAQSIDFNFPDEDRSAIKVLNVLKCIDIDAKAVNIATWNYCNNFHITYRDNVLREHLININSALEEINEYEPKKKKEISKDLKVLNKLADAHDAAYVRFINS